MPPASSYGSPVPLVDSFAQHRDLIRLAEEHYPAFSGGQREDQPKRWAAIARGMRSWFPCDGGNKLKDPLLKLDTGELPPSSSSSSSSHAGHGCFEEVTADEVRQRDNDTEKRAKDTLNSSRQVTSVDRDRANTTLLS